MTINQPKKANCDLVVVDYERGVIEIDGETVPYYIEAPGPSFEDMGGGEQLVTFACMVSAKAVKRIGKPR